MPVLPGAAASAAPSAATGEHQSGPLLWILLGAVLAVATGGAIWSLTRRGRKTVPPRIEPPIPRQTATASAGEAAAADGPLEALAMSVEAITLSRSFLNATVDYRVTLRNRLSSPLGDIAVDADLTSASGERPVDQQLATAESVLERKHNVARLMPGQSLRLEGKVQFPVAQASVIRQGNVALLVPLLRIRASAANARPVVRTLVVGQGAPGASRPQPFRLDEPPRSYSPLVQRALDPQPGTG